MAAPVLAASPWLALPLGLLCLLSAMGLLKSIIALGELYNPSENFYALSASQTAFRFQLTRAGSYEVAGARPGQLNARVVDLTRRAPVRAPAGYRPRAARWYG